MENENLNNGKSVLLYIMVNNLLTEDEAVARAVSISKRYSPLCF